MGYRLGVDVGGTFTDVMLIDEASGGLVRAKTPSTPHNVAEAVLIGVERVVGEAGIDAAQISAFMHGTTVATNTILERTGARVGLIVNRGYRQILHIGRSFVPGGLAGWIVWPKPEPLAALEDTIEISGRMNKTGEVIEDIDEAELRAALRELDANDIDALTISLLHSYVDDSSERLVGSVAASELPDIPISLSSEVRPEIREHERTLTAVANSYVRPRVSRYLQTLRGDLESRGLATAPHVLRSDGGLMPFTAAETAPVNLLLSGPAGGVAGALWFAAAAGHGNVLTLDMGGTSTDVALVEDGTPRLVRETAVGDLTVRVPSIDVRTVGAGGGSIAHVPELTGALRVGPSSAGADPGPAAYGRGGTAATVTDANVVLGYLPSSLLGGEMQLEVAAATAAVQRVADQLGLGLKAAAEGIIDIVNEHMYGALRLVSVQQGYDPRDFALVAFGGAGPLHANSLASLMGAWPVIVPPSPGLLCAFGAATTRLRTEFAKTHIRRFSELDDAGVGAILTELRRAASDQLFEDGTPHEAQSILYQIDVRYHGQAFELTIEVDPEEFSSSGLAGIASAFDAEHERLFSFALGSQHELVNLRAVAEGPAPDFARPSFRGAGDITAAVIGSTTITFQGDEMSASVYDRAMLGPGDSIPGPAIVTELDSTTLILPGHRATVDDAANMLIEPERHS